MNTTTSVTTAGTHTITVPAHAKGAFLTLIGGGAAGGDLGDGEHGQVQREVHVSLTPGMTLTVHVGAGGTPEHPNGGDTVLDIPGVGRFVAQGGRGV